jgi:hypothetical protein
MLGEFALCKVIYLQPLFLTQGGVNDPAEQFIDEDVAGTFYKKAPFHHSP